ncbi:methyltransferase domain-containing protein [Priestia megaterium]|jgi:hypothetical protein|uniref:methyltransferase domain-containing protein n=1 Tax=Priestia megaterium TaxID=1404 RepID=UPI0013E3E4DD|nr:methyltransferase domain-containing protein [Priestia megaterium]MDI3091854.1 SAM-dependent methyltransferase [Priestia megaterium]MED3863909.1 SAM-dependent methyltransferase [Priestia megaterium]MED4101035.1 SAM-dependent methyltransferase [Priestia megaterium]MED4145412.1 SAM-dependent methyltransferase [Priestia megaterium]MED4167803.1 SAM-dependent methyltransferase [Priestia megaterium]
MITLGNFQDHLIDFSEEFELISRRYNHTVNDYKDLEVLIDEYSKFITNERNKEAWEKVQQQGDGDFSELIKDLRKKSALCVTIMEKYRALKLQSGDPEIADYFKNIESCIEEEFGSFEIKSNSKVLLVGSGSFPMTPLLIAKRTGAKVLGIDIDDEAITLGINVVEKLGKGLSIQLEKISVEDLGFTKDATHIIFSSTVESKYDILDQLYSLTNENVVVAMRYGNHLKSLFNYPLKQVDEKKWKMVENIVRPEHIFDIALYKKA